MTPAVLWLLPALPAALAGVIVVTGRRANRWAGPAALGMGMATVAGAGWALASRPVVRAPWLVSGGEWLDVGLRTDGLGGAFALLVAGVSTVLIAYAVPYMRDDPSRGRFFGLMSLFVGAMLALVLARDLVTLLAAWEVVGACSYALIGFWYADPAKPPAANQAFLVTRTADLGLFLAVFGAFAALGTFELEAVAAAAGGSLDGILLALVAVGIFAAAAGKSAQLPFSTWLFGAMEGPTPVSALLHSATMVAAGAYLVVRLRPVLAATGWGVDAAVWLGVATALVAALVALWQDDLKRLLAASTTSQYGYVIAGAAAGTVPGSVGHLVNHAAFKALLFCGAGVLLHGTGTVSLRELGGLRRRLPAAAVLFGVGALALAGVPPLGGFFTKDEILASLHHGHPAAWGLALLGTALTAAYAARAWYAPFGRTEPQTKGPGAEPRATSLRGLLVPMAILAAAAAVGGVLAVGPVATAWAGLLGGPEGPAPSGGEALLSAAVVAAGLVAALALARLGRLVEMPRAGPFGTAAERWFGLDRAGAVLVVGPVLALSRALAAFDDRFVDGGVRGAAALGRGLARIGRGFDDLGVDGFVRGIVGSTLGLSRASRAGDDRFVDRLVEGIGRGVVRLGGIARRPQTGALYHYYAMAVAGIGLVLVVLVLA